VCAKRVGHRTRRHKERGKGKRNHSVIINRQIAERDGWICHLCGESIDPNLDRNADMALSVDHIIPKSQGGPDTPDNLKAAHRKCNWQRNDMSVEEWFSVQTTEIMFMRITS
jgi:5-methylcytosine-specific restriction endonuclease McrA